MGALRVSSIVGSNHDLWRLVEGHAQDDLVVGAVGPHDHFRGGLEHTVVAQRAPHNRHLPTLWDDRNVGVGQQVRRDGKVLERQPIGGVWNRPDLEVGFLIDSAVQGRDVV